MFFNTVRGNRSLKRQLLAIHNIPGLIEPKIGVTLPGCFCQFTITLKTYQMSTLSVVRELMPYNILDFDISEVSELSREFLSSKLNFLIMSFKFFLNFKILIISPEISPISEPVGVLPRFSRCCRSLVQVNDRNVEIPNL